MNKTYEEFMESYAPADKRSVIEITPDGEVRVTVAGGGVHTIDLGDLGGWQPFVVIHGRESTGKASVVVDPVVGVAHDSDHLCIDVHSFLDGEDTTAAAFGLSTDHPRATFPDVTGEPTSHGWPSRHLIAILVGEQGVTE